jgi:hypothetical protein
MANPVIHSLCGLVSQQQVYAQKPHSLCGGPATMPSLPLHSSGKNGVEGISNSFPLESVKF